MQSLNHCATREVPSFLLDSYPPSRGGTERWDDLCRVPQLRGRAGIKPEQSGSGVPALTHPMELNKDSSSDALSVKTREQACLLFCLLYTQCSNRNFKGDVSRLWVLPRPLSLCSGCGCCWPGCWPLKCTLLLPLISGSELSHRNVARKELFSLSLLVP